MHSEDIKYCINVYKKALEMFADRKREGNPFLCNIIRTIDGNIFSNSRIALEYFKRQRPSKTRHVKFYNHPAYNYDLSHKVWWIAYEKVVNEQGEISLNHKQRELFLKHLIKILKDELQSKQN